MKIEYSPEEKAQLRQYCTGKAQGHYRTICFACSKKRRNSSAQCLTVDIFSERVVYKCHHCEAGGATFLQEKPAFIAPQYEKPKYNAVKRIDVEGSTEAFQAFLTERAISSKTASVFNVATASAYFPDLGRSTEAVAFPYIVNDKTLGHKVRSLEEKAHVCTNALSSLFGLQNVDLAESQDVIIAEGEIDALSFYEAGILNGTSVPNGASSFNSRNEAGDLKEVLGFLWTAKDVIEKAKRIIIATDMDEPGDKIAEELARRIGRHRCWRMRFPDGCKDANDVLVKLGKEALQACYEAAEAWPVSGLYEADHYFEAFDSIYENGFGERIGTGITAIDEYYSCAPGMLTVVTGSPNAGKSNVLNQILINLARNRGYVSAICSFETSPQIQLGQLTEMLFQKHFFETKTYGERLTRQEKDSAKPFLMRHFKFINSNDGERSDIDSIVERIKVAVFRWGISVAVVDPYSYISRTTPDQNETSFASDVLTKLRMTAKLYGIHVFLVAHPAKPQINADGSYAVPKGYSISGSAHFFNHPDHGITVHRIPDSNEVEMHVWKTRHTFLGKNGVAKFFYDETRHLYYSEEWPDNYPYQ